MVGKKKEKAKVNVILNFHLWLGVEALI